MYLAVASQTQPSKELPFRSYVDFFRSMANFHPIYGHFAGRRVSFSQEHLDRIPYEWFHYDCWYKPNDRSGKIEFKENRIYTVGGIPGAGKSTLLANGAAQYPKIIDLYGSIDDECLETLRAHKYLDKWKRCLILGPKATQVTATHSSKCCDKTDVVWDYKRYEDFRMADVYDYEAIVLPQKIHPNVDTFYQACQKVTDVLLHRPKVTDYWFVMIREAANIIYSRMATKNANAERAKAYLVWALRQLRHVGLAVGLDSQYLLALDKEIRGLSYYTFFKNLGQFDLPGELAWVFGWWEPAGFKGMYPSEYVAIDLFGGTYSGVYQEPPWHKHPEEDLYEELGIGYDWGDPELARLTFASGPAEDMALHGEVVRAAADPANLYMGRPSVKKIARSTNHDRETVRKVLNRHFEEKSCSCWTQGSGAN